MWLRKCSGPKSCTSVCHMIESLSTFWIATCLNGLVSSIFRRPISVGSVCPYILVELVLHCSQPLFRSRYSRIPLPKCIHHQWFMDHWIGVTEDLFTLEVLLLLIRVDNFAAGAAQFPQYYGVLWRSYHRCRRPRGLPRHPFFRLFWVLAQLRGQLLLTRPPRLKWPLFQSCSHWGLK